MYKEIPIEPALIYQLEGRKLDAGWSVGKLVPRKVNQTGANFSVGYLASHTDGRVAFLKAIDYRLAFASKDSSRALEGITRTFNFERDVLNLCAGARMSRVVVAITSGEIRPSASELPVPYLIFELADGDVRARVDTANSFEFTWSCRALHHIAVGLQQLHAKNVYHQDLKPSNVLIFKAIGSKLADLGRASCSGLAAPHDGLLLPGAWMYAPPEQLYDTAVLDRAAYRRAGDLYLFGSMIFFFVTGQPITPQIVSLLHVDHRPGVWSGKFEDVLPYWRDAYGRVVGDFKATLKSDVGAARTELLASTVELLKCATEPDVRHRGHPSARRSLNTSPYDMQRFVSAFDLLATKLETSTARCNAATTERRAS